MARGFQFELQIIIINSIKWFHVERGDNSALCLHSRFCVPLGRAGWGAVSHLLLKCSVFWGDAAPAPQWLHQGRAGGAAQDEAAEWKLGKERKCTSPCWILARMLKLNTWLINKKSCNSTMLPTAMLGHWNLCCFVKMNLSPPLQLHRHESQDFAESGSVESWMAAAVFPDEKSFPAASQPSLPLQRAQRLSYPNQGMFHLA